MKQKKVRKMRGSRSHGNGDKKKRGAGQRGGRGNAGTGKRADTKKPSINVKTYFGKSGFKKKGMKEEINCVNLSFIQDNYKNFVEAKIIKNNTLDLNDIKSNKLLGSGNLKESVKIKTKYASAKALEKAKNSKFEVVLEADKKESKKVKTVEPDKGEVKE